MSLDRDLGSRYLEVDSSNRIFETIRLRTHFNASNVQANSRPAVATVCEAVVRVCGTLTLRVRRAHSLVVPAIVRIWRTNGFDCYFL